MTATKLSYTYAEASAATGVPVRTLQARITAGDLVARRLGTKPIILAADLEAFLASLPEKD